MSVHVLSWAWKLPLGDAKAKLVLLKLADCANDEGVCWPSIKTIVRDTELSQSTVQRRIKLLENLGFLERKHRREDGRQDSNLYRLTGKQAVSVTTSADGQNGGFQVVPGTNEPSGTSGPLSPNGSSGRARDLVFDELEKIFGKAPAGKTERGRWNRARADLRLEEATPEQVRQVYDVYRTDPSFKDCICTPMALASNFRLLLGKARPKEDLAAERLRERMAKVLG